MPRNPQTSGSKQKILSEHIIKKVSLEGKKSKKISLWIIEVQEDRFTDVSPIATDIILQFL